MAVILCERLLVIVYKGTKSIRTINYNVLAILYIIWKYQMSSSDFLRFFVIFLNAEGGIPVIFLN